MGIDPSPDVTVPEDNGGTSETADEPGTDIVSPGATDIVDDDGSNN